MGVRTTADRRVRGAGGRAPPSSAHDLGVARGASLVAQDIGVCTWWTIGPLSGREFPGGADLLVGLIFLTASYSSLLLIITHIAVILRPVEFAVFYVTTK